MAVLFSGSGPGLEDRREALFHVVRPIMKYRDLVLKVRDSSRFLS